MSLLRIAQQLYSDFLEAGSEAADEAKATGNFNPVTGPISGISLLQRTIQKHRKNGRGYVPDLVKAGLELVRDAMEPDEDDEAEEVDVTPPPSDFSARITQIMKDDDAG